MLSEDTTIINKLGLHARAAALFASTAARFSSQVLVAVKGKQVDGKSVMSLMLLGASQGTDITLHTDGEDQQEAMQTLLQLVANRFNEEE